MKYSKAWIAGWNAGFNGALAGERSPDYFRGYIAGVLDMFNVDRARWCWKWEDLDVRQWSCREDCGHFTGGNGR